MNNGNGLISENLRGFARLLNLKTSIVENQKAPLHELDRQKTIVDVSSNFVEATESIIQAKIFGHKNVSVILTLPGGSNSH